MAAPAPCRTPAPLCTVSACHRHRQAFFSFPRALPILTLALYHKLMSAADVPLMKALPSPSLRGPQASIWAAAGSEQVPKATNRHDQDLCQQVTTSLDL